MKKILIPILLLFCTAALAHPQKKKVRRQKETVTKIEFETFTRRGKTAVTITKDSAILIGKTDKKFILVTANQWNDIIKSLKTVQLSSIPKWEPPSKKHQYDGAAHCSITVSTKSKNYQTQTFDGGNPVKQLQALYNAIDTTRNAIDEQGKNYGE